jgi:hypothetical protein
MISFPWPIIKSPFYLKNKFYTGLASIVFLRNAFIIVYETREFTQDPGD